MTTEERLDKIENLLHTMTELQVHHDEVIARHGTLIEKQNVGIQDLIRVSRTLVDSQSNTWDAMRTLSNTTQTLSNTVQALSDEINKLTDTVNRFISGLQKPNGNH